MKRVVFINAHTNLFLMKEMTGFLFGLDNGHKFKDLFDLLCQDDRFQVVNYISKGGNMLPGNFKNVFASYLESKFVLGRNHIKNVISTTNLSDIKDSDIIVMFAHFFRKGGEDFEKMPGKKIVLLNEYNFHPVAEIAPFTTAADRYLYEGNVTRSDSYFREYKISHKADYVLMPFVVAPRFQIQTPFGERKNKAVATGTIAKVGNLEYQKFYGTSLAHKMRKVIYDHAGDLREELDSFMSPYIESNKGLKDKKSDSQITSIFKHLYNFAIAGNGLQRNYFSFNIVSKYNEYKMAVVPEELIDVPAIGAFESMACGCAYIGIDHPMYKDFGMEPGVHYITYDGTVEGLKDTIKYYQKHNDELESIAINGEALVRNLCSRENVYRIFADAILTL
jgi:hypothetical protein